MLKRMISLLTIMTLTLILPIYTSAEGDYEEGDGWIYHDRELKITENRGLINFLYYEEELPPDSNYKHTAYDIEHVVIGENVTDIVVDYYIQEYIPSSTSIEEGNTCYIIDDGWVVNKKTSTLFGAANVRQIQTNFMIINLPTYIKHIGMYAFSHCSALQEIIIPDGVESIADSTFYDCRNLKTIILPQSTTTIGISAFSQCSSLTKIEFGTEIDDIGVAAFDACFNLEYIPIHHTNIETLHGNVFWGCDKLQVMELPSTLKRIERLAFCRNDGIHTLVVNSDGITIENEAFTYCGNVRRLIFSNGKPAFIGSSLFGETEKTSDGKSFISYFWDTSGEIIPYPTLYYTEAYAAEWAPNGETEWNGYPIQQISQEELDTVLAQARGEDVPATTPSPTNSPSPTVAPDTVEPFHAQEAPLLDGWMFAAIAAVMIAVGVVVFGAVRSRRKKK